MSSLVRGRGGDGRGFIKEFSYFPSNFDVVVDVGGGGSGSGVVDVVDGSGGSGVDVARQESLLIV